jgi:hypothetical protein
LFAEEIFTKLSTPLVYIDGKKLVGFIKDELKPLKFNELLECVMNSATILPMITNPVHMYKSPMGKNFAAIKIQAA